MTVLLILKILANITSLYLWWPTLIQAIKYRKEPKSLDGLDIKTPIVAAINTTIWALIGILTKNFALAFAFPFIFSSTVPLIYLKIKSNKLKKILFNIIYI